LGAKRPSIPHVFVFDLFHSQSWTARRVMSAESLRNGEARGLSRVPCALRVS
jgi:hypothetical protein